LQFYFSLLCLFFRLEFRQLWRPKHIVLFPYYYISSKRILSFTCHVVVCAIFPSSSAAAGKIASCQKELSLLTFEASATREREREREKDRERERERERGRERDREREREKERDKEKETEREREHSLKRERSQCDSAASPTSTQILPRPLSLSLSISFRPICLSLSDQGCQFIVSS
jgi:hypothetical protein